MFKKEKNKSLREILSSYYDKPMKSVGFTKEFTAVLDKAKKDMKKAKNSYESMVEIQKKLAEMYATLAKK